MGFFGQILGVQLLILCVLIDRSQILLALMQLYRIGRRLPKYTFFNLHTAIFLLVSYKT